jgi:hypothetical protein
VKTAADTFRANPAFKTDEVIMELETGEALVSFLDEKGAPGIVQRAKILFPLSQIGAISENQRNDIVRDSRIAGKYDTMVDRESAFEVLLKESETLVENGVSGKTSSTSKTSSTKDTGKKKNLLAKILKAIITAITATLATLAGTFVSDKVSGKKTKSRTSATQRVVKNATAAATRTVTRDILGNLIK